MRPLRLGMTSSEALLCLLLFLGAPTWGAAIQDGSRTSELRASASHSGADITRTEAMAWLQAHKPRTDSSDIDFLAAHAEQAVKSREAYPWAKSVPLDLFKTYVLPYTHFDEKPEDWRSRFFEHLEPLLSDEMSVKEAATAVQQGVWAAFGEPRIHFKSNSTPEVLSPSDVFSKRYGSCTGLSIFLADALRSCGIPARLVGVAEWNQPSKGNHNWVEVWFDEHWNIVDAGPGEQWNKVWFTDLAKKGVEHSLSGIYSPVTWLPDAADAVYTVTWDTPPLKLPAIELTSRYKGPSPMNQGMMRHDVAIKVLIVGGCACLVAVMLVLSRLRGIGTPPESC